MAKYEQLHEQPYAYYTASALAVSTESTVG